MSLAFLSVPPMAWQDKTKNVIDLHKDILRAVGDLATCPYTAEAFTELLSRIQAAVCRALAFALSTSFKYMVRRV